MNEANEERTTLSVDFPALLRRRRFLIVTVLLATMAGAYVTLQLMSELYEGQASVLVKLGRENAEVPATVEKGGVFTTGIRKEEIFSEMQMLSSPSAVAAVVDKLGPEAFKFEPPPPKSLLEAAKYYTKKTVRWAKAQGQAFLIAVNLKKKLSDRENAISGIERALLVEREKDSDVISVRLRMPDGNLSVRVLETLLQHYVDEHIRVRRNIEVKEIFDAQVRLRKKQLADVEERRENIRTQFHLSSVADQRALLLRQLQDVSSQVAAAEGEKVTLRAQQSAMRARLSGLPDDLPSLQTVAPNPTIQSIKERLGVLQEDRAKLASRYNPDSQVLRNVDSEIASLREVQKKEEATMVASTTSQANPLKQNFLHSIEQADVKISGLDAHLVSLQSMTQNLKEELRQIDAGEFQLQAVERERKIAEDNYLTYTRKGEEAYIAQELDRSRVANIAVLNPPTSTVEPVYPPKLLIMGLSGPVGLLLGLALALVLEYMGDHVEAPRDRADIDGLSYLGTITLPTAPGDRENNKWRIVDRVQEKLGKSR